MFLLSAKPNIGCAFEQCRLTVFSPAKYIEVSTLHCSNFPLTPPAFYRPNDSPPIAHIIHSISPSLSLSLSLYIYFSISLSFSPRFQSLAHTSPNNIPQSTPPKKSLSTSVRPKNVISHDGHNNVLLCYTYYYRYTLFDTSLHTIHLFLRVYTYTTIQP